MTITVNPDLNLVVEQPLSRLPLAVVKLPRGSKVPIWVQFARDGAVIDPSETLTSGTLVVGLYYKITTFVAGDSFTNVGAASNATSVYFLCTATTPTTWTNSSTLQQCDSAGVLFSLIFSVKKDREYDGAVLVLASGTDFTKFGTGTSTIFKSKCSFSTAEINTLLGVDASVANDESEVTLMGEVSWLGPDESKAFPFQIDLQNDSYKVNDVVTSTPGVQAMSLVTTSTEALLTGSRVITGSSTVTVTLATGLVTLSVPSELVVPSQTGNSGKYLTTNGTAASWATVTGGVTSITGTANEITVTGTTTPTLSLPSALTFTGKTVTGGTFASPTLTTPTIGDGTEAAPSLSFTSDTNTGVYRPAADTVGIVGGGHDILRLTDVASATDYLEIKNGIGVGTPLHVLAEGASANIGVHLQPKGSGLFTISDGTDFNKGIRFRSSSSAASAITLLDAVSTAGRVITLPDATGTLALVSGALGTPASGDFSTGAFIWPTFDQNTAGSAATLTTTRTIGGADFNGSADVTSFPSPGPIGGTTPNTIAGTTGTFSGDLITTGANAQIYTSGAAAYLATYGDAAHIYTDGANAQIYTSGLNAHISTGSSGAHIETRSTFKLNGGTFVTTLSHGATANRAIAFPDAAGTLLLSDGSGANLTALNASNVSSGTLAAARMANAGVHTGDATGTFPAITLNAAQTGITSVGTLTGGATGAGFTVALGTSTLTGRIGSANNTLANADTTSMTALTTLGAAGVVTNMPGTTSASSATTGALTIGNGTAATNVGIGGGNIVAGGTISSQYFSQTNGRITISSASSTNARLTVGATSGWIVVDNQSGGAGAVLLGSGSGNPGIFRSGTTLQVRLADNSADAPISASNGTLSGTLSVTGATTLGIAGSAVGTIRFNNATSGTTTLSPATGALGTGTVTLPLSGTLATLAGTETLTNKRLTQRTGTDTSSATPTINTDNVDFYSLTAQAVDITSFTTNLSGTPTDGQQLWIAITGTAARAITWGATFEAGAVALPTTTVTTTRLDVAFIWNPVTSKWRCMASG